MMDIKSQEVKLVASSFIIPCMTMHFSRNYWISFLYYIKATLKNASQNRKETEHNL